MRQLINARRQINAGFIGWPVPYLPVSRLHSVATMFCIRCLSDLLHMHRKFATPEVVFLPLVHIHKVDCIVLYCIVFYFVSLYCNVL